MFASVTLSDLLLLRKIFRIAGRGIPDIAGQVINTKMFFDGNLMLVEGKCGLAESTPVSLDSLLPSPTSRGSPMLNYLADCQCTDRFRHYFVA